MMERRIFEMTEMRASADGEGKPKISGYAAVFNRLTDKITEKLWGFREKIEPGAFADSLDGDIRALWNHDLNYVLGRTTNGTLVLAEDERGLRVTIYPPETQMARDFMASIARGDVDQMSFGFNVPAGGDEWEMLEDNHLLRTLHKVTLQEVSPATFPAYPGTSAEVRDLYGEQVEIPDGLRRAPGQSGDDDTGDDDGWQALAAGRKREIALIEMEV